VFLILVLIIGGIILVVLNMINIRERKYEVGVLRAIGMKKGKVALQFISELFIVTFLAITIGTAAGSISSVPTANVMLQNQINAQQAQQQQISRNFGRSGNFGQGQGNMQLNQGGGQNGMRGFLGFSGNVNYVKQIDAVMNLQVLMQIILIGIVLTLFSSSVAVIFISRYEPLKILSSRA
jgi:putative ABC transport system permease protein